MVRPVHRTVYLTILVLSKKLRTDEYGRWKATLEIAAVRTAILLGGFKYSVMAYLRIKKDGYS